MFGGFAELSYLCNRKRGNDRPSGWAENLARI